MRTVPLEVPRGSVLSFGIAIDPTVPRDGLDRVEFRVAAETTAGTRTLFEATLPADDPASAHWTDHRIALDPVVGHATRFVFTTRPVARPGVPKIRMVAVALWGTPEILAPSPDSSFNVVLVSFDTLRADHVGVYGSDLPTTPILDRLASEGIVFDDVFSVFPSTAVAHMSMLTGRYPASHGVRGWGDRVQDDVPLLAEILGRRGWRTGAVTEDGQLKPYYGFARGVSYYRESHAIEELGKESRVAEQTFDAALAWIAAHADERWFLFVHTYVVHWPYEPPKEFDLFTTQRTDVFDGFRRRYAGEVRYADAQIARLRSELSRLGVAQRTLLAITSDHGDEFGEHGGLSHGRTLYDEVLHVPLILWAPTRLGPPRRVSGPASLVDVVPTVLAVLGEPMPAGLDGRNLLGPPEPNRVVFAEMTPSLDRSRRQVMGRTADAKWIWGIDERRMVAAYDLVSDPREQNFLTDPAFLERGAGLLAGYVERSQVDRSAAAQPAPPDPETTEKLRALGYVE